MRKEKKPTNTHLVIPPELARIDLLKKKFFDPEDQKKFKEWEDTVKKSIILLSLQKHEGVDMIITEAEKEILQIADLVAINKPTDFSPDGMAKYAHEQHALFTRRELWEWFRELFTKAELDLESIRNALDAEEEDINNDTG